MISENYYIKELHQDFSYKYAELIRKLFAIEVKEREALCSYDSNVAREIDNTYDCPLSIIRLSVLFLCSSKSIT